MDWASTSRTEPDWTDGRYDYCPDCCEEWPDCVCERCQKCQGWLERTPRKKAVCEPVDFCDCEHDFSDALYEQQKNDKLTETP